MNAVDIFMFGLLTVGVIGFVAWIVMIVVTEIRDAKLERQIKEGEVPLDYSRKIKKAQRAQNEGLLLIGSEDELRYRNLMALRTKVAYIRSNGYDQAKDDEARGECFGCGIENNPHPKGSGEAKQWARGYCQASGTQPKEWMERA